MGKGTRVKNMFDAIAGRYDLMNRVMTLGQDQRWRRYVVSKVGHIPDGWILDLASGTGDIARLLNESNPGSRIVGADFSLGMLKEAKKRFPGRDISWLGCDANILPFHEGCFKAVTFGYLLRNVDDSVAVLKEVYRVLKRGGVVVCLDTTPPVKNLFYPFVRFYFKVGIPVLGRMIARDESAYSYLTGSTMDFHDAEALADCFREAGFSRVGYKKFMMGTIGVHWGMK